MNYNTYYYSGRSSRPDLQRRPPRKSWRGFAILVAILVIGGAVIVAGSNAAVDQNSRAQKTADSAKSVKKIAATQKISAEISGKIAEIAGAPSASLSDSLTPSGRQVAVTLIDLSAKNRGEVHFNDRAPWTSASTYKLFVATEENRAVESGKLSWNSPLAGTTLGDCLYEMIHVSDNACPEAWLAKYSSFVGLTETGREFGGAETSFSPDNMLTSSRNLANLLENLARGKLMNAQNQQNLLTLMQQQEYRDGIPAGIAKNGGGPVADKVGFANDYNGPILNDAAIVDSPNGNYVLVIMTNGYSWAFIANLAQWIDAEMSAN